MWKDLSENTSLTPSSRTFCKPQGLWDCLGREKSKRGSPFPTVPDSTKRKDKLERTISDTSGNTSAFSQSSSRPCLSGKPSPRNPFPFKTICITFTRMEMNTRWGTITSYPYTQSGIGIPWLYSDLACSFFRLAQFWSLWNLNLGLLGGGGGGRWTSNWTAISPRLWDGSSADQRTTLKGVNGKFYMHFNRLVVRVETIQICGSWAFMLVILIVAWSYTRLYKCQITWETCQLPKWTALLSWYFSWVLVSVQPRPLHAHI